MQVRKGDVDGLGDLAAFLQGQGDVLAARYGDAAHGESFQASATAVSSVHDSVTAAQTMLAQRMASTSERVWAAARNYAATEESSAAALRGVSEAPGT
jgi:hypothetical protein